MTDRRHNDLIVPGAGGNGDLDEIEQLRSFLGCLSYCHNCINRICEDLTVPRILSHDRSRRQRPPVGSRRKEGIMFRCHLLVTPQLRPIPKGIRTIENWGTLVVVIDNKKTNTITGHHMFVEAADISDFDAWVSGLKVWMGVNHPKEQQFELTPFDSE